jgi:hypothetical protein
MGIQGLGTGTDGEVIIGAVGPNVGLRALGAIVELENVFSEVEVKGSRKSRGALEDAWWRRCRVGF